MTTRPTTPSDVRLRQDRRAADAFVQPIRRQFQRERARVLDADSPAEAQARVSTPEWKALLGSLWVDDPLDLWSATLADLGVDERFLTDEARRRLTRYAHQHAESIADTNRDLIAAAIARADEGKAFRSTRRRQLQALYRDNVTDRASRIAFTESLQATETIRYEAAREARVSDRVQSLKVWFTQRDSDVRDSHAAVDGQSRVVTLRRGGGPGMFTVGGARLEYPRDPRGPAAEVINCRCWVEYRSRQRQ